MLSLPQRGHRFVTAIKHPYRFALERHSVASATVKRIVIKFACLRPLPHRVIYLRLCGLQPHTQLAASSLGKEK